MELTFIAPELSIYIPLCFYLYHLSTLRSSDQSKFTFHYVSTYTQQITALLLLSCIYIPLCFYLYGMEAGASGQHWYHLHSTLFLLIPQTPKSCRKQLLNLHSTMFLLIQQQGGGAFGLFQIYIPLCFYIYALCTNLYKILYHDLHSTMFLLIREVTSPHVCISFGFTFHYVSTYTTLRPSGMNGFPEFTFHYVSTYTVVRLIC